VNESGSWRQQQSQPLQPSQQNNSYTTKRMNTNGGTKTWRR
jgi:hypothetical protein